uniref:Uncharacterized protein n=1 Tax=viral metagenome TaxID=1070528 RepID=A0A6M3JG31_9ZZZZ
MTKCKGASNEFLKALNKSLSKHVQPKPQIKQCDKCLSWDCCDDCPDKYADRRVIE